jgi:hypothetical protein
VDINPELFLLQHVPREDEPHALEQEKRLAVRVRMLTLFGAVGAPTYGAPTFLDSVDAIRLWVRALTGDESAQRCVSCKSLKYSLNHPEDLRRCC